jgi:type IV pilus assembly protein PilA
VKLIQKGFTLIELMIVVAILAILSAIAFSMYSDYTIRAQASEGSALADGMKSAVGLFYQNNGYFPTNNTSSFLAMMTSISGKYVTQVTVNPGKAGVIATTYGNDANVALLGKQLMFSPTTHAGSISWTCKSDGSGSGGSAAEMPQHWCPSSCVCNG